MFEYLDQAYNNLWDTETDTFLLNVKRQRSRDLLNYMLNRSQQIFVWHGLPDTIPERNLELLLQTCGNICITDVTKVPEGRGDAGLYAMWGGLGGLPNAYYESTIFTVANPYLEFNKELKIGVDCVHMRNDALGIGLIPMFSKYAYMLNENEISMNILSILYRIDQLLSADDDRTAESAKQYLNDILVGKLGVISSSEFFEGLQVDSTHSVGKNITELIEYEQYLKASWYNEIGLNSNYNMKRERIVSAEAELTDDALIPLVENMLYQRQQAIEQIKDLYGDKYDLSDLRVDLNSIWDLDNMYTSIPQSSETDEPQENETDLETDPEAEPETDLETEPETDLETEPETDPETITEVFEKLDDTIEKLDDLVEDIKNEID